MVESMAVEKVAWKVWRMAVSMADKWVVCLVLMTAVEMVE